MLALSYGWSGATACASGRSCSSAHEEEIPDEKRMLRDFLHCYVRPCDLSPSLGALSRSLGALLRLVRHAVPGFSGSPREGEIQRSKDTHPPSPPGCVPRFSDAWFVSSPTPTTGRHRTSSADGTCTAHPVAMSVRGQDRHVRGRQPSACIQNTARLRRLHRQSGFSTLNGPRLQPHYPRRNAGSSTPPPRPRQRANRTNRRTRIQNLLEDIAIRRDAAALRHDLDRCIGLRRPWCIGVRS